MFQCKDLYSLSSLSQLKIIAGTGGLHRGIRWVYKAESLKLSQWVHGEELLIISKLVSMEPDFDLENLLLEAINLNMSGALLLIGPNYIDKVSKPVIELCDKKQFPLFAIPWNLPLVDFFEEIGHAISNSTFHQDNRNDVIFNIIFENQQSASLLELQAAENNYDLTGANCFFLLNFTLPDSGQTAEMERSINRNVWEFTQRAFIDSDLPLLTSVYSTHMIGIFPAKNQEAVTHLFETIIHFFQETYPDLSCNIGVGTPIQQIAQLKRSYEQAAECINYCRKRNLKFQICSYDQLGIYQLFSDMSKTALYEDFINKQLGVLIDYDAQNHTQLLSTLELYLKNNCNLLHTAHALFTHRNTIKYRMKRIEELLHQNLEDSTVLLNLNVALYLKNYVLPVTYHDLSYTKNLV